MRVPHVLSRRLGFGESVMSRRGLSPLVAMLHVGIVAIGRNEGSRLRRCLLSFGRHTNNAVYVDSGSHDSSVADARALGADVVELDMTIPFSAARARNAGINRLRERFGAVGFVQFVDGDCELVSGWIDRAIQLLQARPELAAVCGRLRERYPDASIYNRMCDVEWDKPTGDVAACGGIAMFRVSAFLDAGGFDPTVIAGEEPELCLRLRQRGWRILRVSDPMALHDANMAHFYQWWKRHVRGGHAYAQGAIMHARTEMGYNVRPLASALFWGIAMPSVSLVVATMAIWSQCARHVAVVAVVLILSFMARVWWYSHQRRWPARTSFWNAVFILPAKAAQCCGAAVYFRNRLVGRRPQIIEHKQPPAVAHGTPLEREDARSGKPTSN